MSNNVKYTAEDIFRIVKERSKTQIRANSDKYPCMYRAPNGLKCFIGELIPDEVYNPEMEGQIAADLLELYPEFKDLFTPNPYLTKILNRLQVIHDAHENFLWVKEIYELEKEYTEGVKV